MHDQDDVPFADAFQVWLRVAALSFGGQAGSMVMMHRLVVDEKKWIGEARFLHALYLLHPSTRPRSAATRNLYRLAHARHPVVFAYLIIL